MNTHQNAIAMNQPVNSNRGIDGIGPRPVYKRVRESPVPTSRKRQTAQCTEAMQPLNEMPRTAPTPSDPVAWRVGISCLGLLSFFSAIAASFFFFGWAASVKTGVVPFPGTALLGFVPAAVSLGLGVWSWRARKFRWQLTLTAVACGALSLAFAFGFIAFGTVLGRIA